MTTRTEFPRPIREIEHTWLTLSDGCRLAARIWLPEDAEADPVPAILEFLPYRKVDGTAIRDARRQPYVAGFGYATVRVDMRGTGESDGLITDEYTEQEHADCLEVMAWLREQPWCDGNLGMWGISWGGFNALQLAALRPPGLKAIMTLMSTDDRYADDVHYRGGCVEALDMLHWASSMLVWNARPPDPRLFGDGWHETWLERLEGANNWIEPWLGHQRRDAYWKHGSVCEDYSAIDVPVYAVGGWVDGYTNAVPRMLEGLSVPRKGLIGPWAHAFPDDALPGPSIGFLQECVRWWDHWLKGIDTGIMDEPMLRAWMQDSAPPQDVLRGAGGALGGRAGVAVAEHRHRDAGARRRTALHPRRADVRSRGGRVVRRGWLGRPGRRPAGRGRRLAHVGLRAARGAARDPRAPAGRPGARGRSAAGARLRSGSATWRRTAPRSSSRGES